MSMGCHCWGVSQDLASWRADWAKDQGGYVGTGSAEVQASARRFKNFEGVGLEGWGWRGIRSLGGGVEGIDGMILRPSWSLVVF